MGIVCEDMNYSGSQAGFKNFIGATTNKKTTSYLLVVFSVCRPVLRLIFPGNYLMLRSILSLSLALFIKDLSLQVPEQ